MSFWMVFGVFFWCFPKFAKNAAPHENAVNSSEIVGPAAAKTSKIQYEIGSNTRSKTASKFSRFLQVSGYHFLPLLG